jgi:threonine/homoserine/homoserine lactone efflux protein
MLLALAIGFVFGFVGSMPVAGPIAALVFAQGLQGRLRSAAAIAVGGALAEAIYAFLAFWGFASFLTTYPWVVPVSRGVAATVLIILGVIFARHRAPAEPPATRRGWGGGLLLGFAITALNPTLIATWSAATTTLFSTGWVRFVPALAPAFAAGACVGIAGWFALLLLLLRRYRDRFRASVLTAVIRAMGFFLIAVGLWFFFALLKYLFEHAAR